MVPLSRRPTDEQLLGHRKTPVQRHQHRAEPCAGIKQHQTVGPVFAADRDAIARLIPNAALSAAVRSTRTKTRVTQTSPSNMIAGLSVNAALCPIKLQRSTVTRPICRSRTTPRGDAVETEFGGPRQHRTAAAVAIDLFQRQRFEQPDFRRFGSPASRSHWALHRRTLRRVGAQHLAPLVGLARASLIARNQIALTCSSLICTAPTQSAWSDTSGA